MQLLNKCKQIVLYLAVMLFFACQQPGKNSTGNEFMPDMGHSVAYEANYYNYYYNNTWGSQDEYYQFVIPRTPVEGTIARGYAADYLEGNHGKTSGNSIAYTPNGSVPYYYGDSEEERTRATVEIVDNPYPITETGLARGKELYVIFCDICHGENADGLGYLAREDGGKYPAQPANLLLDEFVAASNGRYYHSIMYGKNLMGAYKDKLSYEERWQVIHYIRSLQAVEKKLEYNQYINTLNEVDRPAGALSPALTMEDNSDETGVSAEGGNHSTDDHSH